MNLISIIFLSILLPAAAFQTASYSRLATSKLNLQKDIDDELIARRLFCTQSLATLAGASTILSSNPSISYASDSAEYTNYDDTSYGFTMKTPASWLQTEQKLSGRRKAIFFTDPNSKDPDTDTIKTLAFIAYTPLRDDFTSLASFGSVDEVAQSTILPKSDLAGNKDTSELLSAVSKNNAYYFDYTATPVVPIGETEKSSGTLTKNVKTQHFRSIFTLLELKGAAGLTLVTITLQTSEDRYAGMKGVFDNVIDSFGKVK